MGSFKSLRKDFYDNRWRLATGLLALLVVDVLQLFIPRVVKHAIDDLTVGTATSSGLLLYALEVLFLALGIGGFRCVWRYLLLGTARRIEKALRDRLFLHLQALPLSYFSQTKVGDLMAHSTNDVEAVRMALALGLVFIVDTIILGALTIVFMVYIHPLLTLYAIVPMPLITLIALRLSGRIHQRFEVVQKTFASLTERVREAIAGIRVVKAYVQEGVEREKLSSLSQEYLKRNIGVTRVWGMFFPSITLLSSLSMAIVLYFGGRLTLLRSISPGDFVAFMSYLGVLAWPMMALGWAVNLIQRGGASMDRLNRIFAVAPGGAGTGGDAPINRLRGRIEMRGLSFSPGNGGDPILVNLDLTVEEGERLAIVGRTGSGKTTLCNLLTRVTEPPEGSIFIDGVEVHRIPLDVLRRSVGYVPQDTFLFSDTLRENIAFGRLDATEEEIAEAARLAQIYDEIMEFPDRMETVIGEKGVTLSGGQRQRIAIARAILMKPAVFILDNALSSVDLQTEERILEGLETFLRGRTSVLVTHRIAPLRRAGRIAVLEGGRLVELGDHSALLAKGGVYSDLYWREQLEEELEKENSK